jgi:hypothetical protein
MVLQDSLKLNIWRITVIYDVFVQYFNPCLYLGWYTSYSQKGTQLLSIQLHELSSHLGQHLGNLLVNPHVCS